MNRHPAAWDAWLPWALFAGALALRLYRLQASPLWLDELYGVQLGRLGPLAILQNSWFEPTPPLYHLLTWLGSGFATASAAWAYRWPAVLAGAVTVPLVYGLARRWAGRGPAALVALALLVSPAHLYYSQEARSYAAAACVAALSGWVLLTGRLAPPARWRAWAAVTAAGLLLNYSYVMVAGVQALFILALARRQRGAGPALVLTGLVLLGLAPFAAKTLPASAGSFSGEPLTLWITAQALTGGDLARYGVYWGDAWLAGGLGVLALLGTLWLARRPGGGWALYWPAQLWLPLAGFFLVVRPLAHINLQIYQSRQFLVLLPAACLVAAAGLAALGAALTRLAAPRWLPAGLGALLAVALLAASGAGLARYWAQTKSPEGQAAQFVRAHGAAGAAVVSLHYSVDAALSVYAPDAAAYFTKPRGTPAGPVLSSSLSVQVRDWPTLTRPYTLADVAAYPRRWVIWLAGADDALAASFTAGCAPVPDAAAAFGPFNVALVENCPPPAAGD